MDASSHRTKPLSRLITAGTCAKREIRAVRGVACALISVATKRRAPPLKGILFFVDLNELDYSAFVLGAKKYSIKYNNTTEIMLAYKKMFFEGVTDGH